MLIQFLTSLSFPIQFQSLLLLVSLVAIVKAAVIIPQNPGCSNTEGKRFPQSVKVNLNILNRSTNPRRPTDYYNRSTSPWDLQYVSAPDKMFAVFYFGTSDCQLNHLEDNFTHSESSVKSGEAITENSDSQTFILQTYLLENRISLLPIPNLLDLIVTDTKNPPK